MNKKDKLKELTQIKTEFQGCLDLIRNLTLDAHELLGYDRNNEQAADLIWDYLHGAVSQKQLIKELTFVQK